MFVWPEFSTAMLNEFRWPLTISANLVSLHLVVSLKTYVLGKGESERKVPAATTAGPVSASVLTGGTGSSSVAIQPLDFSCINWVDELAKTSFERKKNERLKALRRRIAA